VTGGFTFVLLFMTTSATDGQVVVNRGINPWTGQAHRHVVAHNPWTGRTVHAGSRTNPWTGTVVRGAHVVDPWTGRRVAGGVARNPWTGQNRWAVAGGRRAWW
jgi:hypothetical protein